MVKDVSGKDLNVGDTVAYCLGGKGTQMRTGKVLRMTGKSVIIAAKETRWMWNGKGYDERLEDSEVIRAFDAVSKVEVSL